MPAINRGGIALAILPSMGNMSSTALEKLQTFIHHLQQTRSRLLWVTRSIQKRYLNPDFAQTISAMRTIRSELSVDAMTYEIDHIDAASVSMLLELIKRLHTRPTDSTPHDYEFTIVYGKVHVSRLLPTAVQTKLKDLATTSDATEEELPLGDTATTLMQQDEVEVNVRAMGMNFKDVLISLGMFDIGQDELGLEAAGIVHRAGLAVQHLKPGDPVFVLGAGSFRSTIITKAALCARIPAMLSLHEAATIPMAFSTAIHVLVSLGDLKPGQMIGADIYATVGNDEKAHSLNKSFGIQRERIFSSRNGEVLRGIKRLTHERGVDVVLNSLYGGPLHDSCECVAKRGKLVNIAKPDHVNFGSMPLGPLKTNTTYTYVDMTDLLRDERMSGKRLLGQIVQYYARGYIAPLPMQIFAAPDVKQAFRTMQGGQHTGKIIVSMNHDLPLSTPEQNPFRMKFRGDAAYLVVGGLGGLGRAVCQWMADHGARHLILMSRNVSRDLAILRELESQGCVVTPVKGDVCNMEDARTATSATNVPLRGVLNLSMVLRDQAFSRMTLSEWNTAVKPKVQGTWNLHTATSDLANLDFFVLFGSASGTLGTPGQANYAAANTFMDSFVQYRHTRGLAASAIDIGAVQGIGYISQNPHVLERMKWLNYFLLSEKDLFDALTIAIASGNPNKTLSGSDTSFSHIITGFRGSPTTTGLASRSDLFVDNRLSAYLSQTREDTTQSKLKAVLNVNLSVFEIMSTRDLAALGEQALHELRNLHTCV